MKGNITFAPIIVFAFNRTESICRLIESLLTNEEAPKSDVFVFVDGPRKNKNEKRAVYKVQEYVKTITGFRSVQYFFSSQNKGLGNSIITGVGKIINKYGKAIVLEDDLICSRNFLAFMNQALDIYEKDDNVFSVCGYSNIVKQPKNYIYDAYACVRSSSWGWATWKDRWESVDWELNDWEYCVKNKKSFNIWGGSDCFNMLRGWKKGRNKSWAIRFCYSQFIQNKVAIFPFISKISNEGFDGSGTNCKKFNRFKCCFDQTGIKVFSWPKDTRIIDSIKKSAISYHSIYKRIYSKLMYMLKK